MSETILARLEASRKELLDLGMRNPLLNYKPSSARGLHIVHEKASSLYDILVKQGKAMSFVPVAIKESGEPTPGDEQPALHETEHHHDTKLQTREAEAALQNKLLNTYYAYKTSIEEQGVNILYISLGMLHWFEAAHSEEERKAPLILVPVNLDRSSARERFRIRYTLEEMGANISLQAKMKTDFDIMIPDVPEPDDIDIDSYFEKVTTAISTKSRWRVQPDEIELGFFSFGKFMIYNDLDSNKWPVDVKPVHHPVLMDLFERGFRDEHNTFTEELHIDKDTQAHQLFQVVDADSSQLLAMLAVNEGKNLVIQGPPGTGKSQTITNIIANAIGQGKKVLFVAEKMAALEVVKRRLDNIHLGEACLELHSHKANKKELHQELRRVLDVGKPALQQLQQEVALLENYKEELNAYCIAVNTPVEQSHLTVHQLTGYLLDIYEQAGETPLPKIPVEDIADWNTAKMISASAFADRVQARLHDIGLPQQLLFWGSRRQVLLPNEQETLQATLQQTIHTTGELQQTAAASAQPLLLQAPADYEACNSLAATLKLLSLQPGLRELHITHEAWLQNQVEVEELLATGRRLTELHEQYKEIFIPEAWDQPVMEIRQNLLAHGHKWYKFLIGDYKKSNRQLAAICKAGLPNDNEARLQYVDAILENKRLDAALKEHETLANALYGKRWQKLRSDWTLLAIASKYLFTVHQGVAMGAYPAAVLDYLQKHEDVAIARQLHDALVEKLNRYQSAIQQLVQQLQLDEPLRFGGRRLLDQPFTEQLSLLAAWQKNLVEIHQAIAWNNLVEMGVDEKLEPITQVATGWQQGSRFLKLALQKTWYEYLLQKAITHIPALRKFERTSHEAVVQQFRHLDKLNQQYNRARVALKHWENMPRIETAGGQVTILRTEFNKKARHKPIRKLIEEAGLAIQAIKPVFMMSPLSIANFLPPGVLDFDLIVFDEASQVRPVDALGAIMRGKQLVVVGDTKQLPPTSFFDSLTQEVDDEDNVTADLQSILGMCDAQGAGQRMLRWHYRSRHESLIMLSNQEFYENRLVIFPSPGSRHNLGLVFHHLKDTVYDRGNTRTNPKEADMVAEAILGHARQHAGQSLGVVAFSSAQRQAIEDALEIKRRTHPGLEAFFKSHADEPFFIKNLENVQGDERDVIFISIGYGRTADGQVSMSFGPLNNDGGERRLNVLITRAKLRCEVFTNITADDIDTSRLKRYSIQALKNFLYFAQHGTMRMPEETRASQMESPFEDNVARKLTSLGYTVRKQVGSRGFYIDLAIADPAHPGRYIIGIECDGAAYHSARSARDRDRLRQQVLESIGWRLHRIWSTDWYRNPDRELKRTVEAIEKAKMQATTDEHEQEEAITAFTAIEREAANTPLPPTPAYQLATVPNEIATLDIHQHTVGQLSVWVEEIVKVESPVHIDEVARRLIEAAGVARIGNRIKDSLKTAIQYAEKNKWIRVDDEFLWHRAMERPLLRDRSNLPATARKLKYIAPGEMMVAVEKVVRDSVAILPDDAVIFVARLFGFSRVTEDMKEDILLIIQKSIDQQVIVQEGDFLKLNQ